SIAALSLPLFAQEMPNTTTRVLEEPPAAKNEDSPLVKAAKASAMKRTGKKPAIVITNENLAKSGGHIFVANPSSNPPLTVPKQESVSKVQAELRAKAEADAAKVKVTDPKTKEESAAKKEKKLQHAAADLYGDTVEERIDDPSMQEQAMERMTSTQPKTAQ